MSYDLLSEPIRRYIRDRRWDALRPIQAAAIQRILQTDENYILASRTASGKTEAAFLPILSKVDFQERGVQVLYISPLIALINDQFQRVEDLCKYMEVPVTKWHGEASKAAKDRLLKAPAGVLLITPESLEAMLVNHPYNAKALFAALKFVVIDEIHGFLGTDRGAHLKSLLSRIRVLNTASRARVIGLSATIGDYEAAKAFTGEPAATKVLLDKTAKEIEAQFCYVRTEGASFSPAFFEALYEHTKAAKVLLFPNSRGRVEELAVGLKKVAERKGGHPFYFSHHSSVDRELREYVETFAKSNVHQPFCIVCTSTLELGIDIGSVDLVVQIDATPSIASLIQRIGRSGRRDGQKSTLQLYATTPWALLQAYACWELYQAGFIEPIAMVEQPFDLLFHQILSTLKETSGLSQQDLIARLRANAALAAFSEDDVRGLLQHMVAADHVEDLRRELIVGLEGERLTSSRDFYAMFSTAELFKVLHAGQQIGEVEPTSLVQPGENILLAASIWKILDVDERAKKVLVRPAKDGKPPIFLGDGGAVHPRIREKMLELLYSPEVPSYFDEAATACLAELRLVFRDIPIEDLLHDRPCILQESGFDLYTFTGSRINRTIAFLLDRLGIEPHLNDGSSCFQIRSRDRSPEVLIDQLRAELPSFDQHLAAAFAETPGRFAISKWGAFLPEAYKLAQVSERLYDLEGTAAFLAGLELHTGVAASTS